MLCATIAAPAVENGFQLQQTQGHRMFIGHLPAGYLATSLALKSSVFPVEHRRLFMIAGLASSVVPDIDVLYFYLVDRQQHHHHSYWTHVPLFWICILALVALVSWKSYSSFIFLSTIVCGLNVFVHLILDSIAGSVQWLRPFSEAGFSMVEVPARYRPWVLNFIFHWTFLLEIVVVGLALVVYIRRRTRSASGRTA